MSRSSIALAAATAAALTVGLSAPRRRRPPKRLCRGTITGATTVHPGAGRCDLHDQQCQRPRGDQCRRAGPDGQRRGDRPQRHGCRLHKVSVTNSRVGGAISLSTGGAIALTAVVVAGSVTLTANRQGTKALKYNAISGKLSCTNNAPAPTGVARYVVSGGNRSVRARLRQVSGGRAGGAAGHTGEWPGDHDRLHPVLRRVWPVGNSAAVFPLQRLGSRSGPSTPCTSPTTPGMARGVARCWRQKTCGRSSPGWRSARRSPMWMRCYRAIKAATRSATSSSTPSPGQGGQPVGHLCVRPGHGQCQERLLRPPDIPILLRERVVPQADLITPNQFELGFLTGTEPETLGTPSPRSTWHGRWAPPPCW